jgi:hypothetical protein
MPQPRSGSSRSRSGARSGTSKRSSTSSASSRSSRSAGGRRAGSRSTSSARSTQRSTGQAATDAQFEAVAQRLRKLNERIIAAGKDAGETTLTNYERALKAIASAVERGPGSSDIEWISQLANAQAKFIRDVTNAWTSAARDVLK